MCEYFYFAAGNMLEFVTQCGLLSTGLCFCVFLLTLLTFCDIFKFKKKLPRGPYSFPLIGNMGILMKGDVLKTFRQLRSQYGDVYSLKLGSYNAVVVNGYDALKELLTKRGDVTSDRPDVFIFKELSLGLGLVGSSGPIWRTHRTFAFMTLRNFGLGKENIEDRIVEELEIFLQDIESKNGQPFDIDAILQTSVSNIICSIIFGHRFEHTDKRFSELLEILSENFRLVGPGALISFFPFLKYMPGDPCKGKQLLNNVNRMLNFLHAIIEEHNEAFDEEHVTDYIDAYLKEKNNKRRTFTDLQLSRSVLDLFIAGTETSTTVMKWAVLYLLHYPEVQVKMRQELDTVVGTSRHPSLSDRKSLPYCQAVIIEVLRCGNVAPLSVQHSCSEDIVFNGCTIPKGTIIIPNLDSVLSDSNIFENAENFNPERFIDKDGQLYGQEKVVAFSVGRRVCLGESLARSELFLYITSLVQRFCLHPVDVNNLPSLDGILGFSRNPAVFQFLALKRNQ